MIVRRYLFWQNSIIDVWHGPKYSFQKQSPDVFYKKALVKNFAIFQKKTSVWESLFDKASGLSPCNFIKKRLQHKCFPVKFAKFLRTPILKNIYERLLLFFVLCMYLNYYKGRRWRVMLFCVCFSIVIEF